MWRMWDYTIRRRGEGEFSRRDIIVSECDWELVSGALTGTAGWLPCFSLNSVERILKLTLILSAECRCVSLWMPFYILPLKWNSGLSSRMCRQCRCGASVENSWNSSAVSVGCRAVLNWVSYSQLHSNIQTANILWSLLYRNPTENGTRVESCRQWTD